MGSLARDTANSGNDGVRVAVVCRPRVFADSLAMALDAVPDIEVVGTADRAQADLDALLDRGPHVVLAGDALVDAEQVIRSCAAREPRPEVLAVGVPEDESAVLAWVEAGAGAYVTREASLLDLVAAVRRLARGEAVCSPRIAGSLLRRLAALSGAHRSRSEAVLTQREREVVSLIERGLSNKEIARDLGIQVTTVKGHVHNILEKLDARRRSEIVARVRAARWAHAGHPGAARA